MQLMAFDDIFCEAARVSLKVTEIKQQYWSEFIFRFSGKFAI